MNYLTDEDYETANKNGISHINAYKRVYEYQWTIARAITTPVKRKEDSLWLKYKDQVEKLGITQMGFYQRINKGMLPEIAATTPRMSHRTHSQSRGKLTQEVIETAVRNGINYPTLRARVYLHRWGIERAMTEPVHVQHRRKELVNS
jgi:predicted DNA-binding transcriptional regulator AlpA